MIDLTKKALPNTIVVDGRAFSIYTDFRIWLKFMIDLDEVRQGKMIDVSYLFVNDMPTRISIPDLMDFASPKNELPRITEHSDEIMLDFVIDSDLIYSAFLGQYGIDLIDCKDLHWHKFLALLHGITEGTKLYDVMGYRSYKKNISGDQYEKLKMAWKIDKFVDDEEEKERFESLFD